MTTAVLQFLGAAGSVTAARFLIETDRSRVLVDAGLFQGLKDHRQQNWKPFPVPPAELDAVVLTHAHIDHSGFLPALVRDGFRGPILSTHRTRDLCGVLLPDAAHLQEEEARYANAKRFSKHQPALPLYTSADAAAALKRFETVGFHTEHRLTDDITVTFTPAGHILGSASVLLSIGSGDDATRVLVSGDLGRNEHPILQPPSPPPAADVVLLESTYGDRTHPDRSVEMDSLADAISRCAARGGKVLIPAFAVDRTEVVLLMLRELMSAGRIPRLPVYADSPMALRVLDIYLAAEAAGDVDLDDLPGENPFDPGAGLKECPTPEDSIALSDLAYPSIIISASGMATGGRVLHHLRRLLPDSRNLVVLSGFQAAGTRGRALADGARQVKMLGNYVPVRAEIATLSCLSVHADAAELEAWFNAMPSPPNTVYVVHGEQHASDALANRLSTTSDAVAVVPKQFERVALSNRR